jgi:hypothetical protein
VRLVGWLVGGGGGCARVGLEEEKTKGAGIITNHSINQSFPRTHHIPSIDPTNQTHQPVNQRFSHMSYTYIYIHTHLIPSVDRLWFGRAVVVREGVDGEGDVDPHGVGVDMHQRCVVWCCVVFCGFRM